jgi:hypothetical protein
MLSPISRAARWTGSEAEGGNGGRERVADDGVAFGELLGGSPGVGFVEATDEGGDGETDAVEQPTTRTAQSRDRARIRSMGRSLYDSSVTLWVAGRYWVSGRAPGSPTVWREPSP